MSPLVRARALGALALGALVLSACGGSGAVGRPCPPDSSGIPVSGGGKGEWESHGLEPSWTELWRRDLPPWPASAGVPLHVAAGLQEEVAVLGPAPGQRVVLTRSGVPAPGRGAPPDGSTRSGRTLTARWTRDGRLLVLRRETDTTVTILTLRRGREESAPRALVLPSGLRAGGSAAWALGSDGTIFLASGRPARRTLVRIEPPAGRVDTLTSFAPDSAAGRVWAVGPHDRVVVVNGRAADRLTVLGADGRAARRICRPSDRGRMIDAVLAGAEGRVWVGRKGGRWEVFGPHGRYLGRIAPPAGGRPVAASGRTVWKLSGPDGGPATLAAFRLELTRGARAAGVGSGR
ncbi:MAG TPA: hypothetical protein VKA44_04055 [Gemmatimonadota bacterium]|nr:hypothetical protein [Gemmatimonadota bacterium]